MPRYPRLLARLSSGTWLTPDRITAYLRLLILTNFLGLALAICRAHGWLLPPEPHFSTEFMSFYAAGKLVNAGTPALVYAPGIPLSAYIDSLHITPFHWAMQQRISGDPKIVNFSFFYPPVYWLLCAPLAYLGFYPAFFTWITLTFAFLLAALRRIAGRWQLLWPILAYLPVIKNAAVGENAFLSTALLAFGLLHLERRPYLAGLFFGGLCYKPHFLLPVGILLLAGLQWRAILTAALSAATLCLAAAVLYGWQPWIDYFTIAVPHAAWAFRHGGFSYAIQVTPFSAIRLLGGSLPLADAAQTLTALFAALSLIFAASRATPNIRAAVLAASFPLLCSVMLDYDFTLTGLAILFLYLEAQRTGFLPWEKSALAALFALPLLTLALRTQLHLPLDPLVPIAFIALLCQRIRLTPAQKS
jgi:hypothetical protein